MTIQKSVNPDFFKSLIIYSKIGFPDINIIGFGRKEVRGSNRVPNPAANKITFKSKR